MDFDNYDENGFGKFSGLPDDIANDGHFKGNRHNGNRRSVYSNRTDFRNDRHNDSEYRHHNEHAHHNDSRSDMNRYESKGNRKFMNVDIDHEAERNILRRRYIEKHGFDPSSVAAFALTHPESVEYIRNAVDGELLVRVKEWNGRRGYTCPVNNAADRYVIGFDATIRLIKDWETMRVEINRTFPDTPINWMDIYEHMLELRRKYKEEHGYESNTVAAMADADPDRVTEFTNENGVDSYRITFYNGKTFVCAKERANIKQVRGYDALFDQLDEYVRNREADLREKRAAAIKSITENAEKALSNDSDFNGEVM